VDGASDFAEATPGLRFGGHTGVTDPDGPPAADVVVCLSEHDPCPGIRSGELLIRLPLHDGQVPPPPSLDGLVRLLSMLLDEGKSVLIACDLGLNRSGMVAARVLVERGMAAADAIHRIRSVRPGALGSAPAGLFRRAGQAYASWLMSEYGDPPSS
jgi:hypothetical protein